MARARPDIDILEIVHLGIAEMMIEDRLSSAVRVPVVEDHDPPAPEPGVERLDRDQIGQQHLGAHHREQDRPRHRLGTIGGVASTARARRRCRRSRVFRREFFGEAPDHRRRS